MQTIDPRFVAPAPRYKIVARDPDTVCVDRQKYVADVDPCTRPIPPTPTCWTRYVYARLGAVHNRRPQNSGIFTPPIPRIYLCLLLPNPSSLLVDVHFVWSHFNTVSRSLDTSIYSVSTASTR